MFLYKYTSKINWIFDKIDEPVKRFPSWAQGFIGGFVGLGVNQVMFGPPGDNIRDYIQSGGELSPGSFGKWFLSNSAFNFDYVTKHYVVDTAQNIMQRTSEYVPLIIDKINRVPDLTQQLFYSNIPQITIQSFNQISNLAIQVLYSPNYQMLMNRLSQL